MRGRKPGCAEIMWSVQIKSPGPLILLSFLMEEGLALDLHERILCIANKHEGQTNFQSFKALNLEGRDHFSTNLFIPTLGK